MSNGNGAKWITRIRRLAIYARDHFCCVYCLSPNRLTLDHLRPRNKGGGHGSKNLVTACYSCNSARGDKPWWLFANPQAQQRIKKYRRRGMKRRTKLAKRMLQCMTWSEVMWFIGQ